MKSPIEDWRGNRSWTLVLVLAWTLVTIFVVIVATLWGGLHSNAMDALPFVMSVNTSIVVAYCVRQWQNAPAKMVEVVPSIVRWPDKKPETEEAEEEEDEGFQLPSNFEEVMR